MNHLFYLALGATLFCLAALLLTLFAPQTSTVAGRRLHALTRDARHRTQASLARRGIGQYIAERVHGLKVRLGLSESATLRARLMQAGYRGSLAEDIYTAARTLGPVVGFFLGSLIHTNRAFWMIAFSAVAYLIPDMVLQRMVASRREKIRLGMPDAIDLLVICVDAGLGLDQALLRVGQELSGAHPALTAELLQINGEQRAGKLRIDAWQDMEARVGLPELSAFVNMLMQTERFGTPIARALSNFADGLRLKRRQRAEELAAKTTVKIIFPLVLFIFPCIFLVLLGPAVLTIMRGLSAMAQ